jgi:hypothetical protein
MILRLVFLTALIVLATSGCGRREPADPLSLLPENAMLSVVVTQPVFAVRNIDGYVASGAPFLGSGLVENEVAKYLGVLDLEDVSSIGIDPQGSIVFWMESMMPQSMAMAVSITDFPLFLAQLEKLGLQFQPGQAVDNLTVFQAASDNGTIYAAESRGVALLSMNRSKLSAMSQALDSKPQVDVEPGSILFSLNIGMIGPMAASQLPMIAQSIPMDSEIPGFAGDLMNLYFDAAVVFLNQTQRYDMRIVFGPDNIAFVQSMHFKEGSDLARLFVTPSNPSLLGRIPAGDVMSAQVKLPVELTTLVMEKVYGAMGFDVDPHLIQVWGEMSGCGAMSFFSEGIMSFLVVYEMPSGADLESMSRMIMEMAGEAQAILPPEMVGMVGYSPLESIEIRGVDFVNTSLNLVIPGEDGEEPEPLEISYWFAAHDGLFMVETGDEPSRILQVVSGDFTPASEIEGLYEDGLMSYAMEVGGYLNMFNQFSPEEVPLPADLPVLWVTGDVQGGNGVVTSSSMVSGSALVRLIGSVAMAQDL